MQKKLQLVNQVGVKVDYADGNLSLTNTGFMISPVTSVNGNIGDVNLTYSDVNALPDTYVAPVTSVNGKTGDVILTASDVGAATVSEVEQVQDLIGDTSVATQIASAKNGCITGLSVSGQTVTYTKGDGSTGTITTQDLKTRQTLTTGNTNYPLLMAQQANTVTTDNVDNVTYRNNSIYANPSTGMIAATSSKIGEHVTLQYDSMNECLNFVFS